MSSKQVVLITGASSGIGREAAQRFAKAGFRVFGASRRGVVDADVESVVMDVSDDRSVAEGVAGVVEKAGQIDVLVNNAGYTVTGAIEETSIEQAHALFETNFFGAVRVAAAVLPHMRARRQGRIVHVGSVVGFLPAPYMGFYAASKHAMEGWSVTLDHELRSRGVRVALVQPGFTRTAIDQSSARGSVAIDDYAEEGARVIGGMNAAIASAVGPEIVAETILRAATARSSRLRWRAGREAKLLRLLSSALPGAAFDSAMRKRFLLDPAR
jgi:NAD(P)-dependent dehydrogenase (short-subunit alcohol dehydrogenase family)